MSGPRPDDNYVVALPCALPTEFRSKAIGAPRAVPSERSVARAAHCAFCCHRVNSLIVYKSVVIYLCNMGKHSHKRRARSPRSHYSRNVHSRSDRRSRTRDRSRDSDRPRGYDSREFENSLSPRRRSSPDSETTPTGDPTIQRILALLEAQNNRLNALEVKTPQPNQELKNQGQTVHEDRGSDPGMSPC